MTSAAELFGILIILLIINLFIWWLFIKSRISPSKNKIKSQEKDIDIIKTALSEDEKKITNEIEKAKEITQDSLRFRLGWSKAKISTILTKLDKIRLIQRKREGKTYLVSISKELDECIENCGCKT